MSHRCQCLMLVLLATQEEDHGSKPSWANSSGESHLKNTQHKKGLADRVTQMVEHLPGKCEAWIQTPVPQKKKKKKLKMLRAFFLEVVIVLSQTLYKFHHLHSTPEREGKRDKYICLSYLFFKALLLWPFLSTSFLPNYNPALKCLSHVG
jgi:hypothetical protein